jgi:hypothetical protein
MSLIHAYHVPAFTNTRKLTVVNNPTVVSLDNGPSGPKCIEDGVRAAGRGKLTTCAALSAATATTHAHTLSHTTPEKKSCSIDI